MNENLEIMLFGSISEHLTACYVLMQIKPSSKILAASLDYEKLAAFQLEHDSQNDYRDNIQTHTSTIRRTILI